MQKRLLDGFYESSEDIRELYADAKKYYRRKDPFGIQVVEYNLNRLLEEFGE